ncbi:MAG: hypothetical protein HY520_01115 [Candidatus Aenigmarchaeota archaeon]|nr:hypothetical protein [Candidatus Aenigmarchaeota archaeon]
MVLETALALLERLLELNPFLLLGVIVVAAYLAFRIFQTIVKMLITGIAFGLFPILANLLGIPIPLTLQTILWSVILGIATYMAYMGLSFFFKVVNAVFSPLKKGFQKKKPAAA